MTNNVWTFRKWGKTPADLKDIDFATTNYVFFPHNSSRRKVRNITLNPATRGEKSGKDVSLPKIISRCFYRKTKLFWCHLFRFFLLSCPLSRKIEGRGEQTYMSLLTVQSGRVLGDKKTPKEKKILILQRKKPPAAAAKVGKKERIRKSNGIWWICQIRGLPFLVFKVGDVQTDRVREWV